MPKQVIVQSSIEAVEIIDTSIPTPRDTEIVIKVVVSGTNPKDWKYPLWYVFLVFAFECPPAELRKADVLYRKNLPHNSGDDIAGVVYSVGKDVYEFKPGDRVAALHAFGTENGSFAEYAVAPDWTTFHIPHNISFEEAATIPVAGLTAAIALYVDMRLPPPYSPRTTAGSRGEKMPIVIYGVTSAVGAFAAKYARLSGLGPIIGIAGRGIDFGKTLCDYVCDYRNGEDALVMAVEEALRNEDLGSRVPNVFDAISENGSFEAIVRFIDPDSGTVSMVLPPKLFAKDKEDFHYPPGVKAFNSAVPQVHSSHRDFGYLWSRYLGRLLEDGRLKAHPYEVIPGGLHGVLDGLKKLKDGKASAVKYVYRIEDTEDTPMPGSRNTLGTGEQPLGSQSRQSSHPLKDFPFPTKD